MCAILQLVSAPLNPIPIAEHFRRSHPQCEHSYGQHNVREDLLRTLNKHFTYKVRLMMSSYLGLFLFIFFCSNKFKDKQEKQVRRTYYLIDAKSCMEKTK